MAIRVRAAAFSLLCFLLGACARTPIRSSEQSMRPLAGAKTVDQDEGSLESFVKALEVNCKALEKSLKMSPTMTFGPKVVRTQDYLDSLNRVLLVAKKSKGWSEVTEKINSEFVLYEVYGDKKWGEVFMTSYFEPEIEASKKKTPKFSRPVLSKPSSMVEVDIASFKDLYPGIAVLEGSEEVRAKGLKWQGAQNGRQNCGVPIEAEDLARGSWRGVRCLGMGRSY